MNERILITGGTGLLGSYLIRWFTHLGYTNITSTYRRSLDDVPADLRTGIKWMPLILPDKIMSMEAVKDHDWVVHSAGLISYKQKDKYLSLIHI